MSSSQAKGIPAHCICTNIYIYLIHVYILVVQLLSPMALLRDKINDLEKQVTVSELANEMKSKKGEYINLDMPFAEAISECAFM